MPPNDYEFINCLVNNTLHLYSVLNFIKGTFVCIIITNIVFLLLRVDQEEDSELQ